MVSLARSLARSRALSCSLLVSLPDDGWHEMEQLRRLTADQYDSAHDFFSTHFDINHLPKKTSLHGGTCEAARIAVVTPMTAKGGPRLWHSSWGADWGIRKPLRTPELCQWAKSRCCASYSR